MHSPFRVCMPGEWLRLLLPLFGVYGAARRMHPRLRRKPNLLLRGRFLLLHAPKRGSHADACCDSGANPHSYPYTYSDADSGPMFHRS